MTEAKIPLAAVIGHPISHSKSPALHGYWLQKYGIKGHYIPIDIAPDDLFETLKTMQKMGFVGANVTIPHKEAVLKIADVVTDRAKMIGAANTLVFSKDGQIIADNTDGYGFIQNIRTAIPNWAPKTGPAVVFGAGGAARAVLASLIDIGVPEIRLSNRTATRAEALAAEFGDRVKVVNWVKVGNVLDDAVTIVNTTSLGMTGQPEFRVPLDGMPKSAVVTDIVYSPLKTKLLEAADQKGCRWVDGLGMLLWQAAPGFARWFGQEPEVDEDLRKIVLNG